jgi:AcrR family transcriptional regulator
VSEATARTKRQEQGDRSREDILDAASRLMAARGFDGTSISTLAKESGLPASSIYWHFGSKEGVLMAVMERGAGEFVKLTSPDNLPRSASRSEKLAWVFQRAARIIGESPEFLRLQTILLLSAPAGKANAAVLRLRQLQRDGLRDALALCFAEPGSPPATEIADRLVDFAGATFEGAFLAAQGGSGAYSDILARLADALIQMVDEVEGPAAPFKGDRGDR